MLLPVELQPAKRLLIEEGPPSTGQVSDAVHCFADPYWRVMRLSNTSLMSMVMAW